MIKTVFPWGRNPNSLKKLNIAFLATCTILRGLHQTAGAAALWCPAISPPPFFRGVECSPIKDERLPDGRSFDDQVRSQSTNISVSVNAIKTKSNSLESAGKGVSGGVSNLSPNPHYL